VSVNSDSYKSVRTLHLYELHAIFCPSYALFWVTMHFQKQESIF